MNETVNGNKIYHKPWYVYICRHIIIHYTIQLGLPHDFTSKVLRALLQKFPTGKFEIAIRVRDTAQLGRFRIGLGLALSRRQTIDRVGQLLGRGLVFKDNWAMKCTTSKLLTCRVTSGRPIWSAFYVVLQSKNKAI